MDRPVEVRSGVVVELRSPAALQFLVRSIRQTARLAARQDGIDIPAVGRVLLAEFEAALALMGSAPEGAGTGIHAGAETSEPARLAARAVSTVEDLVGTVELGELMGYSESYARRLCRDGEWETARRVGSKWLVDRAEVLDRIERKAS